MRPRSKADRLVLAEVLVEAGLTLMMEAEGSTSVSPLGRARQFRDGLMVAMPALHPIRLKNFASLKIGCNLVSIDGWWWISLSAVETKVGRPDERRIDEAIARGRVRVVIANARKVEPCLDMSISHRSVDRDLAIGQSRRVWRNKSSPSSRGSRSAFR